MTQSANPSSSSGKPYNVVCVEPRTNQTTTHPGLIYTSEPDVENILKATTPNIPVILIEQGNNSHIPDTFQRHTKTECFLLLSITTETAFYTTFPHLVTDYLKRIIHMPDAMAERVVTVLHESLHNAIIHGNCEISYSYDSMQMLDEYHMLCEQRISDPIYNQRRITLEIGYDDKSLVIALTDEGKGYCSSTEETDTGKYKPHGRGLKIVSCYCNDFSYVPGDNTLLMSFSLTQPTTDSTNDNEEHREALVKSLTSSHILLVDDVEFNLIVLNEILTAHGFTHITTAKNGKEALQKTLASPPDLIILDLIMPEMDGFTFCQEIRRHETLKNMPIVVQTALTIPEQRTKAFNAGATDFINKPIDADEMIARIMVHLERQKLLHDLALSRERMAAELEDARAMQKVLMPSREQCIATVSPYHASLYSHFQPSSELGGDFWGIHAVSEHELALYVTDFSGHGVTAALNTFRLHAVMNNLKGNVNDPGTYLTKVNKSLVQLLTPGQFATMFYAVINTKEDVMYYAAAASPPPIIIRYEDDGFEYIESKGFPLGVQNKIPYETQSIPFKKGDMVCLYSDALIETENGSRHFLNYDGLQKLITSVFERNPDADGEYLFQFLLDHFNRNYAPYISDDLTITLLQRHK